MNVLDIIIILLIVLSGVVGLQRGVIKEVVMFVGTLVIYFIAFMFKNAFGVFLCKILPFFDFGGLVTANIILYQLLAFILIAALLLSVYGYVLKATGVIQKLVDLTVILTIPSKILGFIVGLLEGYVIMFIILLVISVPLKDTDFVSGSGVSSFMLNNSPILSSNFKGVKDVVEDINNITHRVVIEGTSMSQINIDIMKDLLDCKIISKEDAIKIVETNKLEEVQGIKDFVKNY